MNLNRRDFLKLSALMCSGLLTTSASAHHLLPVPRLLYEDVVRFVSCLRPYRKGTFRLEVESDTKLLIHNYGHGGSGYTLSWGCAREVLDTVADSEEKNVAIIGSGVMGLTTAFELAEAGFQVAVYAENFPPNTTSDNAGALFGPSGVAYKDRERFVRILRYTLTRNRSIASNEWGVKEVDNYNFGREKSFWDRVPPQLVQKRELPRAPFRMAKGPAEVYRTTLTEPPVFLPKIMNELRAMGVTFHPRRFESMNEVVQLKEPVIVNCTGLGAHSLCGDTKVYPIQGQLVHMKPQPIDYCITRGPYMFSRSDVLLLGGSYKKT